MTYTIHLKPELQTLRVYQNEDSYEDRSVPLLSATIHYISDEEIYLCNLVGNLSRTLLRNIILQFYNSGYQRIKYERYGEMIEYDLKTLLRYQ